MKEVGSGYFIQFSPEEKDHQDTLELFLKDNEYEPGASGIKELLMDVIYDNEKEPEKKSPIMDAINENPEAIQQGISALGNLANTLINKKLFKKK